MTFCAKCGAQMQEGALFCPVCGQAAAQPAQPAPPAQAYPEQPAAYAPPPQTPQYAPPPPQPAPVPVQPQPQTPPYAPPQQQYQPPQQQYQNPQQPQPPQYQQQPPGYGYGQPPAPGAPLTPEQDVQQNKTMAILAYIIFFVPLIAGTHKTSPYVKYHTNQGTVLFIFAAGGGIALSIITAIFTAILIATGAWGIITIFSLISWLYSIAMLVLVILGIVNASGGKIKPLPVIGKFNIIK